jgi:hypothetical protein
MPSKSAHLTRTWGTRFDSLPSSPPPTSNDGDSRELSVSDLPPVARISSKDDKPPHDASIFVGRYHLSPSFLFHLLTLFSFSSLPSHVEQHELARLLSDHLSEYADIKSVKVVRDSKGSVCAFVQCEVSFSSVRSAIIQRRSDRPH